MFAGKVDNIIEKPRNIHFGKICSSAEAGKEQLNILSELVAVGLV